MVSNLASDLYLDQEFSLRVLSSSSICQEDLNLLSKVFDLDDIDLEIIRFVSQKSDIQAKDIASHIYLSRDASRKRALKLTKKEILEIVQARAKNSSGIRPALYFCLSSQIDLILAKYRNESNLTSLKDNQSLEEIIRSFPSTRYEVFSLVVTLKQATSPLISKKLDITPQAIRYHLDWLRKEKWIDRNELPDDPNAFYYFLNPKKNQQNIESILFSDSLKSSLINNMKNRANILFEQEIAKLKAIEIEILTSICKNPGTTSKDIKHSLSCSKATKGRCLRRLIELKLARREEDADFNGIRHLYYPVHGLTVEKIARFSNLSTSIKEQLNISQKAKVNNFNKSISENKTAEVQQNSAILPEITNIFSKLNQIKTQEQEIKEFQQKIEERQQKIEKLQEEVIVIGGEEAKKYFS